MSVIVVEIKGGLIRDVYTNGDNGLSLITVDYDLEDAVEDQPGVYQLADGNAIITMRDIQKDEKNANIIKWLIEA